MVSNFAFKFNMRRYNEAKRRRGAPFTFNAQAFVVGIRGLHSSTFQLNVSTFCPTWWGALLISVTKTAHVEQSCGRVYAPGRDNQTNQTLPTKSPQSF